MLLFLSLFNCAFAWDTLKWYLLLKRPFLYQCDIDLFIVVMTVLCFLLVDSELCLVV